MQDLTVDHILTLHAAIIARDGGDSRIVSEANLYQLVFRANLVSGPFLRAALVLYSLAAYPAFREGNKRTAQELAEEILTEGGYILDPAGGDTFRRLADGVVAFTVEPEDIESWLTAHARKRG